MSTEATPLGTLTPFEQIRYAKQIIQIEGQTLLGLASRLDTEFCRAVEHLYKCKASVIVSGMGKAGVISQKIAATLASTGTRSHFLHPAEAVHGDLGRIHQDDVVLMFSQSGETEEVVRLLPTIREIGVVIIAVTSRPLSTLGKAATVVIDLGNLQEACALGLAPSTSTTAMLAMGDALALVTSRMRNFRPEDFARFHPAGALGRQLSKVDHHMRPIEECRISPDTQIVREVFSHHRRSGRRTGAIMIVNDRGVLVGFFTDSDLARLFETRREAAVDGPMRDVMTARPCTVPQGSMLVDAVAIMADRKISELPVVDLLGKPIGMLDITDVVSVLPETPTAATTSSAAARVGGPPKPKSPLFTTPNMPLPLPHETT